MLNEPPTTASPEIADRPTIDGVHELVTAYGTTWKEPIPEEFRDGIMSAVGLHETMENKKNGNSDRMELKMRAGRISFI